MCTANDMSILEYLAINGERALQCENNNGMAPNPIDNFSRAVAIRKDLHDFCMKNIPTDEHIVHFKASCLRGTKLVFDVRYRQDTGKLHDYQVIIKPRLDKAYSIKILGNNMSNDKTMLEVFFYEFLGKLIDHCGLEAHKHETDYIQNYYQGE